MSFLKFAFAKRPLAQGETPLTLFERVRNRSAFSLNSLQSRGQGGDGRYSFIGYDPFAKVWSKGGVTNLLKMKDFIDWKRSASASASASEQMFEDEPLEVLRKLVHHFSFNGKSPVPFCGGAAGFFSYDFGTKFADVEQKVFDDLELPDFMFFFVDTLIAVDHRTSELYFLALAPTDAEAKRKVKVMEKDFKSVPIFTQAGSVGKIVSNLTYEQYAKKLSQIRHYLEEGDTYQVNFSQRFSAECTRDPWEVYKSLSDMNPAPYGCFFDCDDFQIMSSSPELLFEKMDSRVVTKPIKGTVPRGKNPKEDGKNLQQLLASTKDTAELAMIVDMERNDLGKVCDPGSVKVVEHRAIEKYARVIHTVSIIEGKLLHNKDFFDLVEAMFPGGSITGCPKKRTMEIIDELEDFKRGVYTGSAGYIGFDGNGVLNILIRTMLLKDRKLYYQTGGGIVIDSEPRSEYEETLHKAQALTESLMTSPSKS